MTFIRVDNLFNAVFMNYAMNNCILHTCKEGRAFCFFGGQTHHHTQAHLGAIDILGKAIENA